MPRIVFDALAEAQLLQHFQIEAGALLQPLRLDQMAVIDIAFDALAQLFLDRLDGAQDGIARRYVVRTRTP